MAAEAKKFRRYCSMHPEQFHYPYSIHEYMQLSSIGMSVTPTPTEYCRRLSVARYGR